MIQRWQSILLPSRKFAVHFIIRMAEKNGSIPKVYAVLYKTMNKPAYNKRNRLLLQLLQYQPATLTKDFVELFIDSKNLPPW
jgi:hypothetical protein